MLAAQLRQLEEQQQRLNDPAYVEQLARDRLHMCLRGETCYVIIGGQASGASGGPATATASLTPWYARLWQSVQQADHGTSR
jgi:hypothetical protein